MPLGCVDSWTPEQRGMRDKGLATLACHLDNPVEVIRGDQANVVGWGHARIISQRV